MGDFTMSFLPFPRDPLSGFVTVRVEFYSPFQAKQWVDWLIEDINNTVMSRDVQEAEQAIAYLKEQIQATSLADLQNVFFRMIEEHTKTVMLARVTDEYLLKTIDPAVVPERKARPKRALIVILSVMVAGLVTALLILLVSAVRGMGSEP